MKNELSIEWLGINGFRFHHNKKTILLDPWVTRDNSKVCDRSTVAKYIPEADYVFIGHSHWDHLADAAEIYRQTNAVIIGSQTTINICRAQGVPERNLIQFTAGDSLDFGDFNVEFYASVHKQPMLYPGIYDSVPQKINTIKDFLEGGTFALRFNFDDLKIINVGSANFLREELQNIKCDYLLAGIAGRSNTYTEDLLEAVSPKVVIPTHFDYFETPLEENCVCVDVKEFEHEVKNSFPDIKVAVPIPLKKLKF
jgi:L-ascorbate metabolism protein UlaG (beta-lactamase superfamily)